MIEELKKKWGENLKEFAQDRLAWSVSIRDVDIQSFLHSAQLDVHGPEKKPRSALSIAAHASNSHLDFKISRLTLRAEVKSHETPKSKFPCCKVMVPS